MMIFCFKSNKGKYIRYWMGDNSKQEFVDSKSESAMDILKKRYAKGEISREEYLQMSKEIQ